MAGSVIVESGLGETLAAFRDHRIQHDHGYFAAPADAPPHQPPHRRTSRRSGAA